LPRARGNPPHLRGRQRTTHDDLLLPRGRSRAGTAARPLRPHSKAAEGSSWSNRRVPGPAYRQPYLDGPPQGRGYAERGRRNRPRSHRAAGVDWDLRRDMPYSSYEQFQFKVPISNDCDVLARYLIRLEEMRESVKICQQALDGMPEGPIKADAPKIVLPDREDMKSQMESLIYHFKIVTEGFPVPAGQVYQAVESPRGEMGYYVVSDGTAKPYRVHMRNPSFATLQALQKMCEGRLIADVVAV